MGDGPRSFPANSFMQLGWQRVVCRLGKALAELVQLCLDIIRPAVATSGDSF